MTSPRRSLRARVADDPYVRLARHRPFAMFWLGETISQIGDRLNQVALAVLVFNNTGSPLLASLVFVAATLPNVVIGPLGGVLADRFDRRRLMVGTDLARAALVLTIYPATTVSPLLALIMVFFVTCLSLLFQPAKGAVIPDLAPDDNMAAASGAVWLSDALADLIGYPLSGLIVVLLGPAIALAFVMDAISYVVSALFIAPLPIKPVPPAERTDGAGLIAHTRDDFLEGWRFLRHRPALFENTMLSMVAQLSVGVNLALLVVFARDLGNNDSSIFGYPANYAALNTVVGAAAVAGSLLAGHLTRFARGYVILVGFLVMGLADIVVGFAVSSFLLAASAFFVGVVANLAWATSTQALFYERIPSGLLGRVGALRRTFVFGSITAAMFVSGLLATVMPAATVIAIGGLVTVVATLVGLTRPALRHP